jgi:hypothetical protein
METEANSNLLLRQRTFSVDETREQLRQGRPVHKEALVAGAVDYHSLMFGEGVHSNEETQHGGVIEAEVTPVEKKSSGSWAAMVMSSTKTAVTQQPKAVGGRPAAKKGKETEKKVEPVETKVKDVKEAKEASKEAVKVEEGAAANVIPEEKAKDRRNNDGRRNKEAGPGKVSQTIDKWSDDVID